MRSHTSFGVCVCVHTLNNVTSKKIIIDPSTIALKKQKHTKQMILTVSRFTRLLSSSLCHFCYSFIFRHYYLILRCKKLSPFHYTFAVLYIGPLHFRFIMIVHFYTLNAIHIECPRKRKYNEKEANNSPNETVVLSKSRRNRTNHKKIHTFAFFFQFRSTHKRRWTIYYLTYLFIFLLFFVSLFVYVEKILR